MSSSLKAMSSPLVLEPAPLVTRSRKRTVTDGEYRGDHAPPLELTQDGLPAFGTFTIAVLDRQQFLIPIGAHADHHQGAEPIIIQPDIEMHAVDPDVDVLTPAQVTSTKIGIFFFPARSQPCDGGWG